MVEKWHYVCAGVGVACLIVGALVTLYLSTPQPTAAHQSIVDRMDIYDWNYSVFLSPVCVEATVSPELEVVPGESYRESVWIWYTFESQGFKGKDANAAMELWGPLGDGSFHGQISKLAGNVLGVYFDQQSVASLTPEDEAVGFVVDSLGIPYFN